MKRGCLAGTVCLALVLLTGCGASDADARRESTPETGSGIQEEQSSGINDEAIPENGEENQSGSAADDGGKDSSVQDNASGTEPGAVITEEILQQCREKISPKGAYEAFLAGSILKFDSADIKRWRLDAWWKDTLLLDGELEYAYLDLDGDGVEELLVQYKDSPEAYNGVFHYEDGKLYCWQNDGLEGNCRDYPLRDGTMVRQYDYGDNSSYTLFRYQNDGSQTEISNLFVRNELLDPNSTDPCPYYEVDGKEVDESEFEKQLKALVTDRRLESSAWTILVP